MIIINKKSETGGRKEKIQADPRNQAHTATIQPSDTMSRRQAVSNQPSVGWVAIECVRTRHQPCAPWVAVKHGWRQELARRKPPIIPAAIADAVPPILPAAIADAVPPPLLVFCFGGEAGEREG